MKISPKQFLKSRRPNQFSDSQNVCESPINRAVLEFYLDTLASRSQEVEFERFGIRLCRAAISPNFLPNTGPTGGGDGKVDSETHPVSDITALGWYSCTERKATDERWGLAISIQKQWKSKVKSDVKKAYDTGRNYKVIYYLSSRSIRAKEKSSVQDELKEAYRIDVRILDRNWILDQVFENKREELVLEELGVKGVTGAKIKKGPLDLQRDEDLEKLDKKIERSLSEGKKSPLIAEDAIESAILSRELEKPRTEVDGRFLRAERLANECGGTDMQFDCAYQYAWTTFWWYEDFSAFMVLYEKAEALAAKTDNVYSLERLANLWHNLRNIQRQDGKLVDEKFLDRRTKILKDKLKESIKSDENRPSAALYAKFLFLEIELMEKIYLKQSVGKILINLKEAILKSKGLIGFPFKPHIDILTEAGKFLEGIPEYDDLFATIVQVVGQRDGDTAVAKLYLNRGENLIKLGNYYQAIQELGCVLTKLYKHESKKEVVRALYLISIAYEEVGLLWAARGSLLAAASLATSSFWIYGEINTMQATCYQRLKWVELMLGRIPQALDWHYLDSCIRNILLEKGFDSKKIFEQINTFDLLLGILFLRADPTTLHLLEKMPDSLFRLGLEYSPVALIYALSCEAKIPKDFNEAFPGKERDEFFNNWANLYPLEDLPSTILPSDEKTVALASNILGCTIVVNTENSSPSLEISESILAACESFLSTTTLRHSGARESAIEINVNESDKCLQLIEHEINDEKGKLVISVRCKKFNPHSVTQTDQKTLMDVIQKIFIDITARLVIFKDPENDLKKMFKDEAALERSSNFTGSFVTLGNVLGKAPKSKFADWINEKDTRYEYERKEPLKFPPLPKKKELLDRPSVERIDDILAQTKHSDMQVISIIKNDLWNKAKWTGAGYIVMPDRPPVLSLAFEDYEAGKKIFSIWRDSFGQRDENEQIRVAVVRQIDQSNPDHYRIGIGSSIKNQGKENTHKLLFSMTRIHTMTTVTTKNLDSFEAAYNKFGGYLLAPGSMAMLKGIPEIDFESGIVKKEIIFRKASDIGPDDEDIVLLEEKDQKRLRKSSK